MSNAAGAAFLQAKSTRPITVGELLGKAGDVRAQFAKLINATTDEIGFVFATSEGENIVANNTPMSPGDNVVVDNLHYDGALVAHRQLEKRRGIELRIVEHRDGHVTPADIARRRSASKGVCSTVFATLPFAEIHQLGAALAYVDKVGVGRIQDHTVGLTRRLEDGLLKQGYKLFTPPGNRSSVLCFYTTKPTTDVRAAFDAAKVDVTVREGHVRASVALFNNSDEVDRLLEATKRLV